MWAWFPCARLGLLCDTSPERGQEEHGWDVTNPSQDAMIHLHISIRYLQFFCHVGHSCNTQLLLIAMPGLVPNTAVFLALLCIVPDIQPYFCGIAEEASRIYSWLYFCLETPIFHFPYSYHYQITQRSTALLILTFFSPQSFSQVPFFPLLSSANCIIFIFRYAGNLIMKERLFFFLFLISTW